MKRAANAHDAFAHAVTIFYYINIEMKMTQRKTDGEVVEQSQLSEKKIDSISGDEKFCIKMFGKTFNLFSRN